MIRCSWAKGELEIDYHDHQWCVENHDDHYLYEMLVLEGMQAGLSWTLILKRREGMRRAFDGFDYRVIATYDDAKIAALMLNPDVIRNRLKLKSLVSNAQAFLRVQEEYGSFDQYIWSFTNRQRIIHAVHGPEDVPTRNALSDQISKDLKKRGFKFVGSVIVYSYLQAIGVIDDHMEQCFCKQS